MIRFLSFIDGFLARFFERVRIATWVDTTSLAYFRIFFGVLMLVYFLPSWSWLGEVPQAFFNPKLLSFAYFTDDILPSTVFIFFDVLVIVLLSCITLGVRTRLCLLLMFILSGTLYSYTFSLERLDHFASMFLFTYPALAFTNSGTQFALMKDKAVHTSTQAKSLGVLGIAIAFSFLTGGIAKCVHWIDFDPTMNGFINWAYTGYFWDENHYLLAPYTLQFPIWLLEMADYLAAIFEITAFLLLIAGKKYWRLYLLLASIFHLTNLFFLNFGFNLNVLCYGIFIIAPVLGNRSLDAVSFFKISKKYFIWAILGIAILQIILTVADLPRYRYHSYGSLILVDHYVDIFLWIFTISCGIFLFKPIRPMNT